MMERISENARTDAFASSTPLEPDVIVQPEPHGVLTKYLVRDAPERSCNVLYRLEFLLKAINVQIEPRQPDPSQPYLTMGTVNAEEYLTSSQRQPNLDFGQGTAHHSFTLLDEEQRPQIHCR